MISARTVSIFIFSCILFTSLGQDETQRNYLVAYGQVWGFLKYFHPKPSSQDWDKTLLQDFNKVKSCTTDSEFNTIISELINDCGSFSPIKRNVSDSLKFDACYEWIENELFSIENKESLIHLLMNKPKFNNKYIKETPVGKPLVSNENTYDSFSYSPAIQFLALTRYWNVINYYCPNRDIIPRNWTDVYKDHVNSFIGAKTYEDYYFAVRRVVSEIRDGHGFIKTENDPMNRYKLTPFYIENVSDGYYITHVWQDSLNSYNVQRMDRIISINGISVEEKIEQIGTILATSNDYYLSKSTYYLRLYDSDSISLTIERDNQIIDGTLPTIDLATLMGRNKFKKSNFSSSPYGFFTDSLSNNTYCYIDMGKLKRSDITGSFKRALYKTDHIIIDSRNYPNWTLIKLSKALIKGKRKFATFRKMNFDYPGSFEWTKSQTIGNRSRAYNGNIFVLVDYHTMSQAEYTVMALQQHPNTIVIGGQTAGADGNVADIPLPFGIKTVFSGLSVFYPDRTPTQQIGVRRDYQIVQDKSFIEDRRDLILEKALDLIRQKSAN